MDKTCNFNFGTMYSKAKTGFFFEQSSGPKIKWTALEREKISIKVATNSNIVVVHLQNYTFSEFYLIGIM